VTEPSAPAVQPRRAGNLLNILVALAALVAVGGIAFAGGRLTAPVTTAAGAGAGNGGRFLGPNGSFAPGAGGRQGFGGGFAAGANLSVKGTVTAVTSSSITLQLANGGTITLGIDGSTTYHQQESATASSVSTGQAVIVQVAGRGAGGPAPGSSAAPGRSSAPGSSQGAFTGTATDVTIATP
jgi:hypothetical protein